ncbi:MAG: Cof-type HAD-IIB family hydrolase [Scytonematopsis contorta HA4267-MV1]|nr:Cof-type HAD-IIB family hydrolase [Scytonematopsis contorta HA4267-MV1]
MLKSQYRMLATDYDSTIANKRVITPSAEKALLQAKEAGFLLSIVTGRELNNLLRICPLIPMFDLIVAENGAVLYSPSTGQIELLGDPPAIELISQLMHHRIPFNQDRVMTTVESCYKEKVVSFIDELELPLHIIYHSSWMLILPLGVHKGYGLGKALTRFNITSDQVIGFGDAENDFDLLEFCGFSVAVSNALDELKAKADWVASQESGDGVAEFIWEFLIKEQ